MNSKKVTKLVKVRVLKAMEVVIVSNFYKVVEMLFPDSGGYKKRVSPSQTVTSETASLF